MRRYFVALVVSLLCISAYAQRERHPLIMTRAHREMVAKNSEMSQMIDSLQNLVDSLRVRRYEEDSLAFVMRNNGGLDLPLLVGQYSPRVTDSLLNQWYRNNTATNFEVVERYDMDIEHFNSNVPDSVMIRRLENMNSFITLPFNQTVKNYMILYSERLQEKMGRVMGVGTYYFPMIEEALIRYGLPVELKYMAVIESLLTPTAVSRAGARGMWQFMYKTAKSYGLQIDSFIDERYDVEKSVDAAARYLRDAYEIFGDWSLAISSYNCGPGNVNKAIKRAGTTDFWAVYDYLPRETRGYVPAFVGAMYALTYYKEYGIRPLDVGMPAKVDTFHIDRQLFFRQISEVTGIPMLDLQRFNPQYVREIIPGTKTDKCILKLPYKWTGEFMSFSLDSLYNYKQAEFAAGGVLAASEDDGDESVPSYRIHKVKKGETLSSISKKYHVSIKAIQKENRMKSTVLRIGQSLRIPR